MNVQQSELNTKSIQSKLKDKDGSFIDPPDSLGKLSEHTRGVHFDKTSGNISGKNLPLKTNIPKSKNNSLLSAKRTGVLVNRSFTELETHSSNGNVNEIDSVKQEIAVLDHFDQQNINSFQNKSSDQMSSNNDKKQQYTPCVPSQSQRVLQDQEDIHQYIASEIINSEKIAVDASVHLPDKKLVGKQENRASFMTENRQKTSSASDSVPKAKLNFTNNNLTCKLGLYNLRREKKLKKLTKCMSDSAISSDLTDVDSGTISPQPSHIHSWFNAQHHQQYNPHSSAGLFHLDLTGLDKSTLAPNDSQPGVTFLESLPWHEFPKSFVSSLFKVRPYALGRSISVDGLSLWVSTLEKSPNLVEELSPVVQVYSCTDNYQNVHSNNDVNETQNNQSRYPPLSSDESNFRQISHQEGLETVGCSSAPTTELQSNSSSSSTSSSSSPSSASPYMMRRQLGGSMLNFSQEEFNNLEQNLPSDISSLHSGFGGCFSEYRRTSDMDDQSLVGMNDEEEYFYFKSDGERNSKIDGHKSKVIGQRVPPNLALHRFSSSAVFLDAEDLAQEQKCPTNTNKNSWTSTDDSEETAFKYPKMPSLPSKKVNGINDRHSDFVDDNDITLYNDRSSRPYRSMKHTRLPLFQPPKSASTTDLPGDYPMSTSSYRSISPSLSSEVQVEEEDDRQKYISVGIQATQAECATQTEDETKLTSDFTMPLHGHLLKDTQTSNRLSFPFHIPFLVPETGTLHSLPALMMETTNLLKNLTKHLTVEPSLPSLTSETSPKCNISTQTDTKLQTAFSSTQPSLLYSNVQSDLRFGTTQSSPNGTCNIDHSGFYFSKPAQERSDIRIQQNIINPELNINQNTNYSNYTEPCVKTNMTPNPYSLHHQKQNMHLPLNHDTNTLGSNCSVGDTLKGDMCDSFIYHPQHHSNFKEDLQSPGQKYHSYGHQSSSPIDHTATLRSHVTNNDHKGDTIQSSQQRHWHSIPHINENNFSRQFKFNQTSPLPESNSDKYYHSMKYTNPFSTKRPWHDIINYSEYNLDSTAHDIHVEQGWTPQGTRNSPLGQGATENISNQEISGQSYGSCHLKQNLFDPENPGPPPRFRSMTFDCNDINRVKLPSYRNNTLPRAALDPYLTPTGYYSNFDRQSTPCQHYFTMPRHHKYTSASTLDFGNNSKSQFTQSEHQDLQADQYLSEELNMSLKKSGLTDEYLQLLNKSVKSLPHTKQSSLASPSDRPMHRTPNRNSMLPAYKSSNTNSRNTPVLCETIETKSYSDLSNGLATGGDHYGVAKSSGSSVFMDHSQSNDIETVLKINQQYTNMISREGKSRNSGPKSSTQRHKNNKSQKQVLDDGFKEWEQEQLDIMDMVNLKYLPVSFTVKYLEKKVNHCIAQTDLLLDSLDDDDGTTPTEMDDQATSMTDGNTEEDGSSTTSGFSAPAEQFHFPFRRQEQQTSDYSVQSRSLDSSSELSPNTWLQLQSSIPNLLTDEYTSNDSDNNTQVDSTDHVLSTDSDNGIDTRTYIQYLQSSANTSLSNSDQTIPESQDQAMNGSLGQNAISMLKEVSDFRKFYSAEIAKIRDGLYKMDEKVSAHSSSQRNRFSRQSRYNENEISNCDKRHSSCISLNASSSKSTKVKRPTVHTSSQPRHSIVDSPVAYRPQSTPLILRQRSASTEH